MEKRIGKKIRKMNRAILTFPHDMVVMGSNKMFDFSSVGHPILLDVTPEKLQPLFLNQVVYLTKDRPAIVRGIHDGSVWYLEQGFLGCRYLFENCGPTLFASNCVTLTTETMNPDVLCPERFVLPPHDDQFTNPSAEKQVQIWNHFEHIKNKCPMRVGETFYILPKVFLRQWNEFVKPNDGKVGPPPGKIDLTPLVYPIHNDNCLATWAKEDRDFICVYPIIWKLFVSWYGATMEMPRLAIQGATSVIVESRPYVLKLFMTEGDSDDISPPKRGGTQMLVSQNCTLWDLKKMICDYFKVESSASHCLWDFYNEKKYAPLLSKKHLDGSITVLQSGLLHENAVLLEVELDSPKNMPPVIISSNNNAIIETPCDPEPPRTVNDEKPASEILEAMIGDLQASPVVLAPNDPCQNCAILAESLRNEIMLKEQLQVQLVISEKKKENCFAVLLKALDFTKQLEAELKSCQSKMQEEQAESKKRKTLAEEKAVKVNEASKMLEELCLLVKGLNV